MSYKISFAGYYSDCVIFWACLVSFLATIFSFWKKIIAKIALGFFFLGVILSWVPMGIPFFAILLSTTPMGLKFNKNLNEKYRFQITGYSIMMGPMGTTIENKFWFFEKELSEKKHNNEIYGIKNIKFLSEDENFIYLKPYYQENKEIFEKLDTLKISKVKE